MNASPGGGADGFQQAALLIDADNFNDTQSIDAAWSQLKARAGRVSVCRAYGAIARLQALAPGFAVFVVAVAIRAFHHHHIGLQLLA